MSWKATVFSLWTLQSDTAAEGVVFYRVPLQFSVKALQQFGTNVVRLQLMTRECQWYIIGCYLSPNDASTIKCVLVAAGERPRWSKLLVDGNFNAELTGPEGAD